MSEVDFRRLLIEAGRAAGAFLDETVSDSFLTYVPSEVQARIQRDAEALASRDAVIARMREALDNLRATASGREALPGSSKSKDAHRNVLLALSARLGEIEREARTALSKHDRNEGGDDGQG